MNQARRSPQCVELLPVCLRGTKPKRFCKDTADKACLASQRVHQNFFFGVRSFRVVIGVLAYGGRGGGRPGGILIVSYPSWEAVLALSKSLLAYRFFSNRYRRLCLVQA